MNGENVNLEGYLRENFVGLFTLKDLFIFLFVYAYFTCMYVQYSNIYGPSTHKVQKRVSAS